MKEPGRREQLTAEIARLRQQIAAAEDRLVAFDDPENDVALRAAEGRTLRVLIFSAAVIIMLGMMIVTCVAF